MQFITLADDSKMPAFGLGTWKSAKNEVYLAVRKALECGYLHLDCAYVYGNEDEIGTAIADAIRAQEVERESLWITSKLWNDFHKRDQVRPALEKTLTDLQLDYLDLYLIHWNVATKPGSTFPLKAESFLTPEEAPIEATWEALCELKDAGLVKHVGVSNMGEKMIEHLSSVAYMPEVLQVEAHPHLPQNELLNYCKNKKIAFTAYSPLASRELSPAYKPEHYLLEEPVILDICKERNLTPAEVVLTWALERGTSVIPKSTNEARIQSNFQTQNLSLTEEEMKAIATLSIGLRYVNGSFFTGEGSPYSIEHLFD